MRGLEIKELSQCPECIEVRAAWAFSEWGCFGPDASLGKVVQLSKDMAHQDGLPVCWMALSGGRAVGMITLKETEHPDRLDLSPWIGSIFVHPKFRNLGIAKDMCVFVEGQAKENFGFERCVLQTDVPEFYEKMGWVRIGVVRDMYGLNPEGRILMEKEL